LFSLNLLLELVLVYIVGGRTSAKRNPTGTIPGNQAIEQPTNAYINIRQ
jgi:hypothetical protein